MIEQSENQDPAVLASRLIQRMHLQDGLPEMFMGIMLLLCGGSYWARAMQHPSPIAIGLSVALTLAFVAICVGSATLIKWIRRRYLLRRVGYMEKHRDERQRKRLVRIFALIAFAPIPFIAIAILLPAANVDSLILAGLGTVFGGIGLLVGPSLRFKVNGILVLAAGLVLAFNGIQVHTGLAIFFVFTGSLYLASGLLIFLRFLRQADKDIEA